jgi:hypothetical protein
MKIRGFHVLIAAMICAGLGGMALIAFFVVWPDTVHGRNQAPSNTPSATSSATALYTTSPLLKQDVLEPKRIDAPTKIASTLLTAIAPTSTVRVPTSSEASHLAELTSGASLDYKSKVSRAKHTWRGLYNILYSGKRFVWGPIPFLNHDNTISTTCEEKPHTAGLRLMLMYPNGTLLGNPPGFLKTSPIFYVWTRWQLAYPKILLKAILDDPILSPDCPEGHCFSRIIPGTESLRLGQVADVGEGNAWCYITRQHGVSRLKVQLGKTSRMHGEDLRADELKHVSHYVEYYMAERMKTTYPALEIGLIVGLTVGLFIILPIVLWVGWGLLYAAFEGMAKLCSMAKRSCNNAGKQCAAIGAVVKRGYGKIKIRRRSPGAAAIVGGQAEGVELKDVGTSPPSYADATRNQEWNAEVGRMV